MKLLDGVKADATFSPCGTYRYALTRDWFPKDDAGSVLFIMLNPSTATADEDDPTIRRCQNFARSWGFDGIVVANLFALRSTEPAALRTHPDPIGPVNDEMLETLLSSRGIGMAVAAWGVHGLLRHRAASVNVLAARSRTRLMALGLTKEGFPRDPLYVRADTALVVYREIP